MVGGQQGGPPAPPNPPIKLPFAIVGEAVPGNLSWVGWAPTASMAGKGHSLINNNSSWWEAIVGWEATNWSEGL